MQMALLKSAPKIRQLEKNAISIKASGGLDDNEIEQMVQDAKLMLNRIKNAGKG